MCRGILTGRYGPFPNQNGKAGHPLVFPRRCGILYLLQEKFWENGRFRADSGGEREDDSVLQEKFPGSPRRRGAGRETSIFGKEIF